MFKIFPENENINSIKEGQKMKSKTKRGFEKGSRKWVCRKHNGKTIERKLVHSYEVAQHLNNGYIRGSGVVKKYIPNKAKDKSYVYCYQPLNMSLPCISSDVYTVMSPQQQLQYIKFEKLIKRADVWDFLRNNKIWSRGCGRSYNKGADNPHYCGGENGEPRKPKPPRPEKSIRMYLPSDRSIQGKYVDITDKDDYLAQGWVCGIQLRNPKWTCPVCSRKLQQGRKQTHKNGFSCRVAQRKMMLVAEFSDSGYETLKEYAHTLSYRSHSNRDREEFIGGQIVLRSEFSQVAETD